MKVFQHQQTQVVIELQAIMSGWEEERNIWLAIPYCLLNLCWTTRLKLCVTTLFRLLLQDRNLIYPLPHITHSMFCGTALVFFLTTSAACRGYDES